MRTVVGGLAYPECPRWHGGALWFSDQHAGTVQRLVPGRPAEVVVDVDGGPAGLGWTDGDILLVVSMHRRALVARHPSGEVETVADLTALHPGLSNDMVVDAQGRAYVGNIGFDYYGGEEPRPTVLALVDGGRVSVAAEDLLVPNGMVLTADDRLVVAESFAHRLTAFRRGPGGELSDRHVFADLAGDVPDGICMDAEGAVWYAAIGRREVVRVLEGGTVTDRLPTEGGEAVACVLGGTTLYVCTTGELDPQRSLGARSGRIEATTVAVRGPADAPA